MNAAYDRIETGDSRKRKPIPEHTGTGKRPRRAPPTSTRKRRCPELPGVEPATKYRRIGDVPDHACSAVNTASTEWDQLLSKSSVVINRVPGPAGVRYITKDRQSVTPHPGLASIPARVFHRIALEVDGSSIRSLRRTCQLFRVRLAPRLHQAVGLLSIPPEIFFRIVDGVGSASILMLSRTCELFRTRLEPFLETGAVLHKALFRPHPAAIQRALTLLANRPLYVSEMGGRLLCAKVTWRSASMFPLLLNAGANPNRADDDGYTPLHHAVKCKDMKLLKELLNTPGVNLNAKTDFLRRTALHMAVDEKNEDIVRALCDRGADVSIADITGGSALHILYRHTQNKDVQGIKRILILAGCVCRPCGKLQRVKPTVLCGCVGNRLDKLGLKASTYRYRANRQLFKQTYPGLESHANLMKRRRWYNDLL